MEKLAVEKATWPDSVRLEAEQAAPLLTKNSKNQVCRVTLEKRKCVYALCHPTFPDLGLGGSSSPHLDLQTNKEKHMSASIHAFYGLELVGGENASFNQD